MTESIHVDAAKFVDLMADNIEGILLTLIFIDKC